ncbi:hypothetical protein V8E54_009544 [Elaphomyces granulatus]
MVRLKVASMRTAASPVFSKPDFCDVRWAGVFGSFAKGTQTRSSRVRCYVRSHTIAGSDEDDEVVRLRNEARGILDFGLARFTTVLGMILRTQSLEFLSSPQLQRSVRDNIQSILRDGFFLDLERRFDALSTGENANTNDLGSDYWTPIWEIATSALVVLAALIQGMVIPDLREIFEDSELVRKLEMGGEATSSGVLKGLTTICKCYIL